MIQKLCNWILKFALAITAVFIGIAASVPPVCRDSLTHHLYIPKLYLKAGAVYEIPHIEFSYYPQLVDLLYVIALYFDNDVFAKYIHFAFALATSFLIYSYLKDRFDKSAALIGSLIFLTTPVIVKLSVTVYVDLGLIFFTFASIIYLLKWKNSDFKLKFLAAAGIFTGLAMGTKYNGILTLIVLTLILPLLINKFSLKKDTKTITLLLYPSFFALTALIIFSPWMIKNYVWTGSPLYPLYKIGDYSTKNGNEFSEYNNEGDEFKKNRSKENNFIEIEKNVSMNHFLIRKFVYNEAWWETLLIPLRVFFQGKDDNPALFDGKLNPFLFIVPLFFLIFNFLDIGKNKSNLQSFDITFDKNRTVIDKEIIFLLIFSALYLFIAFLKTDMRIRYISPIVAPLVIVYVAGLYKIQSYLKDYLKIQPAYFAIVSLIIVLTLFYNVSYIKALSLQVNPFEYISGKISRSDYISKFRPEYQLIEYLNKNAPKDAKILALYLGDRGYFFDNEVRFGRELLFNAIKIRANEKDIADNLKQDGFTHIIIGFDLFNRFLQKNLNLDEQMKVRDFFQNYTLLIKENGFYGLYELKN